MPVVRAERQKPLVGADAVADVENDLLRIERRSSHIRRAGRLAAPAFRTSIAVEQLKGAEVREPGNAELFYCLVFQIQFAQLACRAERTEEHVKGTINDVSQRRIEQCGDEHEDLDEM